PRKILPFQASQCRNQIRANFGSACPALCLWTWSWALWSPCAWDPLGKSSVQTTWLPVRVTQNSGPRGSTQRVKS
uniref:Uncharacterized protein n=1 Tax=Neovison vison TaxID=452646 RepID=A0A8C7BS99_NEOVI